MKKNKIYAFLLAFVVIGMVACVKDEIGDDNIEQDISTLQVDKHDGYGWKCTSRGPIYNMDLYNEGIGYSNTCRYLHIIDQDNDNELIGTWAIAPNSQYLFRIGLEGLHRCNRSYKTTNCSVLSSGQSYYYEVCYSSTWDDDEFNNSILSGNLPAMPEECDC